VCLLASRFIRVQRVLDRSIAGEFANNPYIVHPDYPDIIKNAIGDHEAPSSGRGQSFRRTGEELRTPDAPSQVTDTAGQPKGSTWALSSQRNTVSAAATTSNNNGASGGNVGTGLRTSSQVTPSLSNSFYI
jgi:hypothetical protein